MRRILLLVGFAFLLFSACGASNRVAVFDTSMGTFKVELYEERAPITTENFIELAESDYYNGLIFHRVIPDFMIQGGCPQGTGFGDPGYAIEDEFHEELRHDSAGVLSMANSGPNTGGSQFFITLAATPWLDGKHAVFGKVIEGMDVVEAIGAVETGENTRAKEALEEMIGRELMPQEIPGDCPVEDVVINEITIVEQ